MGKQYNISELIDGYTDNEFLINGQQGVDTEAVLNGVMAKVKPKKRLRLGIKILAAAAVVSLMSMIVGASLPTAVYKLADGTTMSISKGYIEYNGDDRYSDYDNIYKIEDERVYFTFDGQHIDITDLIDFDNAYYYRSDIVDSMGEAHERWIVVGGTPEHIGWIEEIADSDGVFSHYSLHGCIEYYQCYVDGEIVTLLNPEETYGYIDKYPYRYADFNWSKEVYERYSQEHLDNEKRWKYPRDWEGEPLDDNIPFPEDLHEFDSNPF